MIPRLYLARLASGKYQILPTLDSENITEPTLVFQGEFVKVSPFSYAQDRHGIIVDKEPLQDFFEQLVEEGFKHRRKLR